MKIKSIKLKNFRNYDIKEFSFSDGFNLIAGNNGSGKTNIIEAIYLCSCAKSFKNVSDKDLVKFNDNYYFIQLLFNDNYDASIKISFSLDKFKSVIYNNDRLKSYSQLIGKLIVILSNQDDIFIVRGSPLHRRKFLDVYLSFFDNEYLYLLKKFKFFLEQRNILLKSDNFNKSLFNITNKKFIYFSAKITFKRLVFIRELNLILKSFYSQLYNIELKYNKFNNVFNFEEVDYFLNNLSDNIMKKEVKLGYTCFGPQSDDFTILFNGKDAKDFASYGEQKLIAILLKLILNDYFIKFYKKYPVILLDDVFSDFDNIRKEYILSLLKHDNQIIITSQFDNFKSNNKILL